MPELPSGTVTFLFTDIEGSTRLLHELRERYGELLGEHRRLFRAAVEAHSGVEVDTQGDAFLCAFSRAQDAVLAAAEAQRAFDSHPWPGGSELRVRMGIHTGEPARSGEGYVGLDLHRGARVMAAAHGGQVLLSQATRQLLGEQLPDGVSLRDLGEHRLKDLSAPQRLYQLELRGLRNEFPPPRTLAGRPNNLPGQPSELIGRARELEQLSLLLRQEGVRLLTLTGPGGTGKTRLALALAAELVEEFPDGVFCLFCAPLSDPALVLPSLASTLGLKERPGESPEQALAAYITDKRLLLLLDNLEHLLEAAPGLASLLAQAAKLKLLATSRAPLRLQGEREYPLEPLPPAEGAELFRERARAVRPDLALEGEEDRAIAAICRRLDGLPLAIELAAARVRSLPPSALLPRLEQSLKLLTGGARDLPERQRTLRGAIEWSYSLLTTDEQTLFRRLAVFLGGFTLEAAEAVFDPEGEHELDLLDGLESLIEKSLLRSGRVVAGEPRYFLLETIREYAGERLQQAEEAEALRDRHAAYFLGMAERLEPGLDKGSEDALAQAAADYPNLRVALAHLRDAPDSEPYVRLAGALQDYWLVRDVAEGREWLGQAVARPGASPGARAKALGGASSISRVLGVTRAARAYAEEAADLLRDLGDLERLVLVLNELATAAAAEGDLARALVHAEEAIETARAAGDEHRLGMALAGRGDLGLVAKDYERAIADSRTSAELFSQLGDSWGRSIALINLATALLCTGCLDEATFSAREGLRLALGMKNGYAVAGAAETLAWIAAEQGNLARAAVLLGGASMLWELVGADQMPTAEREVHERIEEEVRDQLGRDRFDHLVAEGRSLSGEEAVALALDGHDVTQEGYSDG